MLTAFTAGLLLITISELGDKTFFMAVILSMKYPKWLVFTGVSLALAMMTILSVMLGQVVSFLPIIYVKYAEIVLFLGFGFKLLYDGWQMSNSIDGESEKDAMRTISNTNWDRHKLGSVLLQSFGLTFMAEWGDRTQIATISLAASNNPWGVVLGATLGHVICTLIAVIGGCLIAKQVSEKMITLLGGVLFVIFGGVAIASLP